MNEDQPDIATRDAETLAHLAAAETALQRALRSMPNHVDSVFAPIDVPDMESALRLVRTVQMDKGS